MNPTDRETLERLEEELWREETRFDRARMERVMSHDFIEYGRSGRVYRRDESRAIPRRPIHAVIPLPDFHARLLAPDVAQVTYESRVTHDGVVQRGRRSSIWTREVSGEWRLRFHQGTPIPEGES